MNVLVKLQNPNQGEIRWKILEVILGPELDNKRAVKAQ
jgi:hypothetical protein